MLEDGLKKWIGSAGEMIRISEVDGQENMLTGGKSRCGQRSDASGSYPAYPKESDRFRVTLDLGLVAQRYGQRGIDRTVLHELGHVIDFALVPDAMNATLDAQIPRGYGCEEGETGSCANRDERFAESFAKWATGDIGVDLYLGYKIPPPDDRAAWGAPLATLLR